MEAQEHSMTDVAPTVSAALGLPCPAQAIGSAIGPTVDDLAGIGKLAILAPDGFGMFAWRLWQHEMPFLQSLHAKRSTILRSVMPSVTPVNFAAMVSGTDLAGHGVSTFKHDFACETLFDVVRRAGGKSAGVGLAGYTGCELLARFADICGNAGDGSDDDVAAKVIEIADEHAPEFIIAQLGRVDDVFHRHGPSSPSVAAMLRETDARLARLVERLTPLGYGVLILADHGQHDLNALDPNAKQGGHGTDTPEDRLVPCTWTRQSY